MNTITDNNLMYLTMLHVAGIMYMTEKQVKGINV